MPKETIRCNMSWIKIKKINHYKVYSVLLFSNKNSITLYHDEKWIQSNNGWYAVAILRWNIKMLQQRLIVTVWWPPTGITHHNFLNPGKIIMERNITRKSPKFTTICNIYIQHWSIKTKGLFLPHDYILHK